MDKLIKAYGSIKIGDPLDSATLMGPLHTKGAIKEYLDGLEEIQKQGGKIVYGGSRVEGDGNYVLPTLVEIDGYAPIVK